MVMGGIVCLSLGLHLLNLMSGFGYDFLSQMRFHSGICCDFGWYYFCRFFWYLGCFFPQLEMLVLQLVIYRVYFNIETAMLDKHLLIYLTNNNAWSSFVGIITFVQDHISCNVLYFRACSYIVE